MMKEKMQRAAQWTKDHKKELAVVTGGAVAIGLALYLGDKALSIKRTEASEIVNSVTEKASTIVNPVTENLTDNVEQAEFDYGIVLAGSVELTQMLTTDYGHVGSNFTECVINNVRVKDMGVLGDALKEADPCAFNDETVVSMIVNNTTAEFRDHAAEVVQGTINTIIKNGEEVG